MTQTKPSPRGFEPTQEERRFLHAFEVLFAPNPVWPQSRRDRALIGLPV